MGLNVGEASADLQTRVLEWDWRAQPDLDELADAIRDLSGGRLHLAQVDTGGDSYAVVLSTLPLDVGAAQLVREEAADADA
jgi:hypothetical protein